MYEIIKKFLNDGGKCLLIENGEPIGVVLTVEEYEFLQSNLLAESDASESARTEEVKPETIAPNPIGEAMAKEINYPEASAEISDIEATNDVTLEDLGVDELPY